MVTFEFDERKSKSNLDKHGINFYEAQGLWEDTELVEIPVKTSDESRYLVIGVLNGKHWTGVITYRESNVRIISVRRSRKSEINLYEST